MVNDVRDTCEPDGAADRAARAARTLAAVAHDAARKHVQRDVVTPQPDGPNALVVPEWPYRNVFLRDLSPDAQVDSAERERQTRLRRWQTPPLSNKKGG